jgi:predicted RND superfamily exporter protein
MNLKPLARLLVKRPKTVILAYSMLTILIGTQITNLSMESDLQNYLPSDDPTIKLLDEVYREFEMGESIIILVEADNIRDPDVLKEMDYVVNNDDMDRYPDDGMIDGIVSVSSLATLIKQENFNNGLGSSKGLYVIPNDENTIYSYMTRLTVERSKGILYTNDYKLAVIVIQLAQGSDYEETLEKTKASIERRGNDDTIMTVTGSVAVNYAMREQTLRYMIIVLGLAVLLVAAFLTAFHRSLKGVLIGFIPLFSAVILTFGVLGIVSPVLTLLSVAIVALLFGLGIDYSIYLSSRFVEEHEITDKVKRVEKILGRTGKAVMLCAFTTIIGFGSLMTSNMPPMISFGFGCAIGISFCFLSSTILVPCLCIVLKYDKKEEIHQWKRFARILINYRKKFFLLACFFTVVSISVITQVKTDVNYYAMAPEGISEIDALFKYSEKFGGSTYFNAILVETEPDGLTYPEVISEIYDMEEEIRNTGATAYSIADELVEINRLLNRSYIIEKIAEFIDIHKIIFDKISDTGIIDENYSKTIILVTFPVEKSIHEVEAMVNEINSIISRTSIPHGGQASKLAGQDVISVEINNQIMSSQATSMIVALILVLACLIFGFKSTAIGFSALLPVFFVLSWEPGALVGLNTPLSIVNITVASIMIGTGIDYSIQITKRIREEYESGRTKIEAVTTALETTGLSIIGAACTTITALLSTFFVPIPTLYQFSMLVISLIILSVTACLFILPTVLASRFIK